MIKMNVLKGFLNRFGFFSLISKQLLLGLSLTSRSTYLNPISNTHYKLRDDWDSLERENTPKRPADQLEWGLNWRHVAEAVARVEMRGDKLIPHSTQDNQYEPAPLLSASNLIPLLAKNIDLQEINMAWQVSKSKKKKNENKLCVSQQIKLRSTTISAFA